MPSNKQLLALVDHVSFFDGFTLDEKEILLDNEKNIKSYQAGETIIKEGVMGDSLFILLKGVVCITKNQFKNAIIKKLKPGAVFGEMAILTKHPRSTNVISDGDVVVMVIHGSSFHSMDKTILDKFKNKLIKILSQHLEEMNDFIASRL